MATYYMLRCKNGYATGSPTCLAIREIEAFNGDTQLTVTPISTTTAYATYTKEKLVDGLKSEAWTVAGDGYHIAWLCALNYTGAQDVIFKTSQTATSVVVYNGAGADRPADGSYPGGYAHALAVKDYDIYTIESATDPLYSDAGWKLIKSGTFPTGETTQTLIVSSAKLLIRNGSAANSPVYKISNGSLADTGVLANAITEADFNTHGTTSLTLTTAQEATLSPGWAPMLWTSDNVTKNSSITVRLKNAFQVLNGKTEASMTEADYKTYGMDNADLLTQTTEGQLNQNWSFLVWSEDTTSTTKDFQYNVVQKDQFVYATGDIDLRTMDNIDYIHMNDGISGYETGNGKIRFVASFDSGVTYKAYNGSSWITLLDTSLITDGTVVNDVFVPSDTAMTRLISDGMTKTVFDAAPWQAVTLGAATPITKVRFGYILSQVDITDTAYTDNLKMQYDGKGTWAVAVHGTDYTAYFTNITLEISFVTGGYKAKVNY